MARAPQRRARSRALDRHGQDMTHVTFSPSGSDAYNDPTDEGKSTTTVTGYLRTTRNPWQIRDAADVDTHERATILVDDSLTVTDENDAELNDTRPDEFHIDHTGNGSVDEKWKVYKVDHEQSGLLECKVNLLSE